MLQTSSPRSAPRVSVYAQPQQRPELGTYLNTLFRKYSLWIMGGDFNAQVSSLDTKGRTVNKWKWLSSLVETRGFCVSRALILSARIK